MAHIVGQIEFDCDIEALSEEIEKAGYVKVVRCEDCMHNGSYDTDCPINWNGKEYCSFAERRDADDATD